MNILFMLSVTFSINTIMSLTGTTIQDEEDLTDYYSYLISKDSNPIFYPSQLSSKYKHFQRDRYIKIIIMLSSGISLSTKVLCLAINIFDRSISLHQPLDDEDGAHFAMTALLIATKLEEGNWKAKDLQDYAEING